MKKATFTFTVLTLLLALVACGGTSNTTSNSTGGTGSTADNSTASLSLEMQLLIGTIKLEETDLAVSADQASQLLPLWQAYKELISSDTAAQAEIDAVVSQIQNTMTQQQIQAITDMSLTRQDEFALMQELGLAVTSASGTPVPGMGERPQFFGPEGDTGGPMVVQGGGPGGGFAGGPGDQGFDPQRMATAQAQGQSGRSNNRVPMPLLKALIDLLQKKVQP